MTTPNPSGSGDGTRPTTDGGVDNIGGAGSFTPGKPGNDEGPAPAERKSADRHDKASLKNDDSAPLGLTQPADDEPNTDSSSSAPPDRE